MAMKMIAHESKGQRPDEKRLGFGWLPTIAYQSSQQKTLLLPLEFITHANFKWLCFKPTIIFCSHRHLKPLHKPQAKTIFPASQTLF